MCGISAVVGSKNPVRDLYALQMSLQHRGQESAGFALSSGGYFLVFSDYGSVNKVFHDYVDKVSYRGSRGIAHNRYSTTGPSTPINAHPLIVGNYAIEDNGNLINGRKLLEKYRSEFKFKTATDTEMMGHFLNAEDNPFIGAERIFEECEGSYNLAAVNNKGELILIRDPIAMHPMVWTGQREDGSAYAASENLALASIGIYDWSDFPPGEVVVFRNDGSMERRNYGKGSRLWKCVMEPIYFMRHGSEIYVCDMRKTVGDVRREWGEMLDEMYPFKVDVRSYVPRSGMGYAMGNGEMDDVFSVNEAWGRIYITPEGKGEMVTETLKMTRIDKSMLKNTPIRSKVKGMDLLLKEDSIIRLNNGKAQAKSLFDAGAKSLSIQSGAAPIKYPCFMGMDHSKRSQLAAAPYETVEEANEGIARQIADHCDVDHDRVRVGYNTIEGMLKPLGGKDCGWCTACFDGNYPYEIPNSLKENLKL